MLVGFIGNGHDGAFAEFTDYSPVHFPSRRNSDERRPIRLFWVTRFFSFVSRGRARYRVVLAAIAALPEPPAF
jgi:hypothetical protein